MGHGHHHHGHHHHGHHHHHHGRHHHGHSTQNEKSDRAVQSLTVALLLNLVFAVIELVGGIYTNSTAVIADAVHDFGDSIALGLALFMERFARGKPTTGYSYGYRRWSLLSAVITGVFLLASSAVVLTQAIPRLSNPVTPKVEGVVLLALLGIAVNGYAAWRLLRGSTRNERMISWHMLEDVLGWVVILVSAVVMMFVDVPILDPILSILYVLIILFGAGRSLLGTLKLFLQGVPDGVDLDEMRQKVLAIPGVCGFHDVHMWSLDGENHVLTGHLVVPGGISVNDAAALKTKVRAVLEESAPFHATIEVEAQDADCRNKDCGSPIFSG